MQKNVSDLNKSNLPQDTFKEKQLKQTEIYEELINYYIMRSNSAKF